MGDRNKKAKSTKPIGQLVMRTGARERLSAQTSTPASSLQSLTDSKFLSDISGIGTDINYIASKRAGQNYSKRLEAEKLALDLTHARYMQSVYLDGTLQKFMEQHKRDETIHLAQLSLLISGMSDHNAYLERMLMATRYQKQMKDLIQQQDKCLSEIRLWLEKSLNPFRALVNALDQTRHVLHFKNVILNSEEISKFSRKLSTGEKLLERITENLQTCNLLHASKSYGQLNETLEKEIKLLERCKLKIIELEDAVIQTSSLRLIE